MARAGVAERRRREEVKRKREEKAERENIVMEMSGGSEWVPVSVRGEGKCASA